VGECMHYSARIVSIPGSVESFLCVGDFHPETKDPISATNSQ
jgi:hypothetical protein